MVFENVLPFEIVINRAKINLNVQFKQIGVKASDNHPNTPEDPTNEVKTSIELRTTKNIQPVFTETSQTMLFSGIQRSSLLNISVVKPFLKSQKIKIELNYCQLFIWILVITFESEICIKFNGQLI